MREASHTDKNREALEIARNIRDLYVITRDIQKICIRAFAPLLCDEVVGAQSEGVIVSEASNHTESS